MKIGDTVIALVNNGCVKPKDKYIITNIHVTIEPDGGNYELLYHVRKNKSAREEIIFKENELQLV